MSKGTLTNTALRAALKKPRRHSDGQGLYLRVTQNGAAFWSFRYFRHGKQCEVAIGRYPDISLADARVERDALNATVAKGGDPARDKRQREGVPTFGKVADDYIAAHEESWRNEKHRYQWRQTLGDGYCKSLRGTPVDEVDTAAVLKVLQPVWRKLPETASRLRGRIETVLDSARAAGHIAEDKANPARWKGHLDKLLSKRQRLTRGHHAAMAYADVPALMTKLKATPGAAAAALRFTILTAARSGEVFGAQWDEFDWDAKTWTVPKERMKANVEHTVPLSDAAIALLREQETARRGDHPFVFPGARRGKPLSNMSMVMAMRRLKLGEFTVHGFRSAFRDWAGERGVDFEVAEQCLAHAVGNAVTAAYLRTKMVERRRPVMQAWGDYFTSKAVPATVVPFRR